MQHHTGTGQAAGQYAGVDDSGDPAVTVGERLQGCGTPAESGDGVPAAGIGQHQISQIADQDPGRARPAEPRHNRSVSH